jgi:uncharacterized protein YrzB (UPF0473 family)
MDTNKMFIIDEEGNEIEVDILFTFDSDLYGKKYVLYQNPNGDQEEVFVSSYDDEGNLNSVEDEEELAMVEEVLGAFIDEEEKEA